MRLAGYGTLVMLTEPDAVRDVFRGEPHALPSGEGNEFLSWTVGKHSVLVLDDEPHARQRRVLLPPLKGERMRSFFEAMQSATLEAMHAWPTDRPIRMVEPMRQITLRVILQAVLGLAPGPALEDLQIKIERLLAVSRGKYGLIVLKALPMQLLSKARWLPFFRQLRDLDTAIFALLDERRRQPVNERGDNVVADLLAASYDDGQPLSNQEIRDAILTLLLAGHETTAMALSWALERVATHPRVLRRIGDELRKVSGGQLPRVEHLNSLNYLDATIRESLRSRTILAFVVRLTKQAFRAGGREYPPGILLCPCNHLVHRREDLYPEPDQFSPERFLERKFSPNEWFPFGGGNRVCLGMAFALYEMKVVLATLFSQVSLSRPPGGPSLPTRRGLVLEPHDGALVLVHRHAN